MCSLILFGLENGNSSLVFSIPNSTCYMIKCSCIVIRGTAARVNWQGAEEALGVDQRLEMDG